MKILEVYKNGKWISMAEKYSKIQEKLEDLQKFCENKNESLKGGEGKFGEILAKFDAKENRWIRVKIIERR